jgi:polysaccharide export outer membrane protein
MRKPINLILYLMMIISLFSSCVTTHQTNYLQNPQNLIPAFKDTATYKDYCLKVGDKLFVMVYSIDSKTNALFNGSGSSGMQMMSAGGNSESSDLYTYIIQPNGKIDFPLVGEINVLGKTVRQTKGIIEEAIKPILKLNSVDVRMVSKSFSIIGSGKSGRVIFPREKINIFQAIAMAGDFGIYTDRSKIRILRETPTGTKIKTFDVRSVDIINSEFYYIEPNDVIFLQPMNAQFFGVTSFWSAVSTVISTYSFAVIIYKSVFTKSTTN